VKDKTLQNLRQSWVLDEIKKLKLGSPVAELSDKTGFSKAGISQMLSGKQAISMNFYKKFCEVYGFNHDAVNHMLIDGIKSGIENDNKLTKDKDRISYTPNEKDALFSTPVLTNGDNFMKELFELLREEQRQRSMLIEQQGHLIAKIPDVERKQNNVKERQVKSA